MNPRLKRKVKRRKGVMKSKNNECVEHSRYGRKESKL